VADSESAGGRKRKHKRMSIFDVSQLVVLKKIESYRLTFSFLTSNTKPQLEVTGLTFDVKMNKYARLMFTSNCRMYVKARKFKMAARRR
jgi:hypothetical protein